jgi:hypothetical protein
MNRLETKRIVFARIPDLNASHSGHGSETEQSTGWGPSGRRLLDQALSFKLLAGGTLLLLLAAVIPCVLSNKSQPADTPAAAGDSSANGLQSPSGSAGGVSPWKGPTIQTAQKPPTFVRPLPAERTVAPVAVNSPPPEVQVPPAPKGMKDEPEVSVWPNPVHPVSQQAGVGAEESPASANQPMTIRPSVYQADARANPRPTEAGTAPNGVVP